MQMIFDVRLDKARIIPVGETNTSSDSVALTDRNYAVGIMVVTLIAHPSELGVQKCTALDVSNLFQTSFLASLTPTVALSNLLPYLFASCFPSHAGQGKRPFASKDPN